jgi:glycosyltransferase involved in cell wall biosynthesis
VARFNYIVTIHNKEDLIAQVLAGVLFCAGENSHVYLVLDGCTDGTEAVVDGMVADWVGAPVTKFHASNVHEILSLTTALRQIPQDGDGYNILLQDDIILSDWNFEKRVLAVNEFFNNNIGLLSFHHGVNVVNDETLEEIREEDLIESCYGQGMSSHPLLPGQAVERMVGLRSPECISFNTVRRLGLLDEKYAPYTYDDHEYGMRCLKAGLTNVVYALKFRSRVEWGGMRRNLQPGVAAIMKRNRGYVFHDHGKFIAGLKREDFSSPPVVVPVDCDSEADELALARYDENRVRLRGFENRRRFNLFRRLREKFNI